MVLKDKAVLVIEDNFFMALSICSEVEALNGIPLGPVATAAEALQFIDQYEISAALIDFDLADIEVTQVAKRLAEKAVPMVIYTAGERFSLGAIVPFGATILRKPIKPEAVVSKLVEELGHRDTMPTMD